MPVEVFYLNVRQSLCYTAAESIFCYLPATLPTAVTEEHSESFHQAGNRNFCSLAADATLPLHSSQVSGRAGASNAAIWGFKSAPMGGLPASGWVLVAELDRWRMRHSSSPLECGEWQRETLRMEVVLPCLDSDTRKAPAWLLKEWPPSVDDVSPNAMWACIRVGRLCQLPTATPLRKTQKKDVTMYWHAFNGHLHVCRHRNTRRDADFTHTLNLTTITKHYNNS